MNYHPYSIAQYGKNGMQGAYFEKGIDKKLLGVVKGLKSEDRNGVLLNI